MKVEVEVDVQEVIDNLMATEIFDKSGINARNCKDQFGTSLLSEFTLSELIEYYSAESFLNEIGEEAAIKQFDIDVAETE